VSAAFENLVIDGDTGRATVRRDHLVHLCEGHFPGDPLVPGAYLAGLMADVGWAVVVARVRAAVLAGIERCVFLAPVRPGRDVAVSVEHDGAGRVLAEIRVDGASAARAVLRFRIPR